MRGEGEKGREKGKKEERGEEGERAGSRKRKREGGRGTGKGKESEAVSGGRRQKPGRLKATVQGQVASVTLPAKYSVVCIWLELP